MKKTIVFALCAILLMSCGGAGQLPTDNVTFGQAWNHVSQSFSYWLWLVVAVVASAIAIYKKSKSENTDGIHVYYGLAALFILLTLLVRPCEVAANTTVEQAARGAWIGY